MTSEANPNKIWTMNVEALIGLSQDAGSTPAASTKKKSMEFFHAFFVETKSNTHFLEFSGNTTIELVNSSKKYQNGDL